MNTLTTSAFFCPCPMGSRPHCVQGSLVVPSLNPDRQQFLGAGFSAGDHSSPAFLSPTHPGSRLAIHLFDISECPLLNLSYLRGPSLDGEVGGISFHSSMRDCRAVAIAPAFSDEDGSTRVSIQTGANTFRASLARPTIVGVTARWQEPCFFSPDAAEAEPSARVSCPASYAPLTREGDAQSRNDESMAGQFTLGGSTEVDVQNSSKALIAQREEIASFPATAEMRKGTRRWQVNPSRRSDVLPSQNSFGLRPAGKKKAQTDAFQPRVRLAGSVLLNS